jgi:acetyl esterase
MPLDPRVKRFLNLLAAGNPPDARSATVEERRKGLIALMEFSGPPLALEQVSDRTLPGAEGPLRARLYSPSMADIADEWYRWTIGWRLSTAFPLP